MIRTNRFSVLSDPRLMIELLIEVEDSSFLQTNPTDVINNIVIFIKNPINEHVTNER